MPSNLKNARLAQRDASRKLYFVSAGYLYHPQAHLVLDRDPTARAALEQSLEAALQFADLSDEEAADFRERAVAATRVVRKSETSYAFEQPERAPRRRRRRPGTFRLLRAVLGDPPDDRQGGDRT